MATSLSFHSQRARFSKSTAAENRASRDAHRSLVYVPAKIADLQSPIANLSEVRGKNTPSIASILASLAGDEFCIEGASPAINPMVQRGETSTLREQSLSGQSGLVVESH